MDLEFYQDWWWNLALVAVAFYIGLAGYEQTQPAKIHFSLEGENADFEPGTPQGKENKQNNQNKAKDIDASKEAIADRLQKVMEDEKLYIQSELNLQDLAQHLKVNAVHLSATINQVFGQNFNDFINSLRIEEFIRRYQEDVNQRFTMLSLALDSGFNSKATFNRAFKKIKGSSPKEYFDEIGVKSV